MTVSILKSEFPPIDQWEEMEIVEGIGGPEEHADLFYRYDNYGIEVHEDGLCQAYVIIQTEEGDEPIMVAEGFDSPEAVIQYFAGQEGHKELSESGAEEMGPMEDEMVAEDEGEVVPEDDESIQKAVVGNNSDASSTTQIDQTPGVNTGVENMTPTSTNVGGKAKDETQSVNAGSDSTSIACSDGEAGAYSDESIEKKAALDETVTSSGHVEEGLKGTSTRDIDATPEAGAPGTQLKGTSTEDTDNITEACPETVTATHTEEGTKTSAPSNGGGTNAGTVHKSFRDMMADREVKMERGLPHGNVSRSALTIQKSANMSYKRTSIGLWDRQAVGTMASDNFKYTRNNEGASVKEINPHVKKGEEEQMSIRDMIAIKKNSEYSNPAEDLQLAGWLQARDDADKVVQQGYGLAPGKTSR